MNKLNDKPLKIINFAVLLQQQRYVLPVSFLFYLYNGLTLSDFVFFQSIFYFTCLLAEIPAGYIGDIFPRKNVLIFSYILFMIRILLWITMQGYWIVMIGEILYGLSKAFYRGVSDGYIYDYLKLNNITEEMLNAYGKYNFYMSTGCAISAIIGAVFYKLWGFKVILSIEFLLNICAIIMLTFLPQIKNEKTHVNKLKDHFISITDALKNTLTDKKINYYIFYTAILAGITSLFVWNFQPLMKNANVPVILFGVLYFINHILRAGASYYAKKIINKIKIKLLGFVVWLSYFISLGIILLNQIKTNKYICFISLILVCIAIGIQMTFNVATVARIHNFIKQKVRATSSSVNSMMMELCQGMFLIIYKFLLDKIAAPKIFTVIMILFIFILYLPSKISISTKNSV